MWLESERDRGAGARASEGGTPLNLTLSLSRSSFGPPPRARLLASPLPAPNLGELHAHAYIKNPGKTLPFLPPPQIMVASTTAFLGASRFGLAPSATKTATAGLKVRW